MSKPALHIVPNHHDDVPVATDGVSGRVTPYLAGKRSVNWREISRDLLMLIIGVATISMGYATIVLASAAGAIDQAMSTFLSGVVYTAAIVSGFALLVSGRAGRYVPAAVMMAAATTVAIALQPSALGFASQSPLLLALFIAAMGGYAALVSRAGRSLLRQRGITALGKRRVAVYGATTFGISIHDHLETSATVDYVGMYDERKNSRLAQETPNTRCLEDLIAAIKKGEIDDVIIPLPDASPERVGDIVTKLSDYATDVWLCDRLPAGCQLIMPSKSPVTMPGAVLSIVHRRAIRDWGYIGKAAFDRGLALLLIGGLSPLLLTIAAIIKLDSSGPVFFRQRRHGFNGKVISVWKFRSMHTMDDGASVQQATAHDKRITRAGKFLRRSSLDELPQLFNIASGEMSFVGPRPHALAHNESYEKIINHYAGRNQVKPGLTGWAQVNGLRGETADPATMAARVRCDLWYIDNWSMLLDLKIMAMTPFYAMASKNAY